MRSQVAGEKRIRCGPRQAGCLAGLAPDEAAGPGVSYAPGRGAILGICRNRRLFMELVWCGRAARSRPQTVARALAHPRPPPDRAGCCHPLRGAGDRRVIPGSLSLHLRLQSDDRSHYGVRRRVGRHWKGSRNPIFRVWGPSLSGASIVGCVCGPLVAVAEAFPNAVPYVWGFRHGG